MERRSNKRSLLTTFSVLCIMLVMICVVTVPGIYAKYTSQVSGTDTATIAKWSFKVNGTQIAATTHDPVSFDLFSTIKDTDPNNVTENPENEEKDVATSTTNPVVAPGTQGEFAIKLENLSDVTASYTVTALVEDNLELEEPEKLPIKYQAKDGADWKDTLQDALNAAYPADNRKLAKTNGTETITIKWKWEYSVNDALDTKIGILAQNADKAPITATITVVAEQVD